MRRTRDDAPYFFNLLVRTFERTAISWCWLVYVFFISKRHTNRNTTGVAETKITGDTFLAVSGRSQSAAHSMFRSIKIRSGAKLSARNVRACDASLYHADRVGATEIIVGKPSRGYTFLKNSFLNHHPLGFLCRFSSKSRHSRQKLNFVWVLMALYISSVDSVN